MAIEKFFKSPSVTLRIFRHLYDKCYFSKPNVLTHPFISSSLPALIDFWLIMSDIDPTWLDLIID